MVRQSLRSVQVALATVLVSVGALVALSSSASAITAAPGWEIFTRVAPTNLPPGGHGEFTIYVYNTGAASSVGTATVTDTLPHGLAATGGCPGTQVVTCTLGAVGPGEVASFKIPVDVEREVSGTAVNQVTVAGGGALVPASASADVTFSALSTSLGFNSFDAWFSNADGTPDTQAGSHPYELTVAFALNDKGLGVGEETPTGGEVNTVTVNLPPGVVANPTAVPQCSRRAFDAGEEGEEAGEQCPADTQVGTDSVEIEGFGAFTGTFKVYNLVPPAGIPAQFAFDWNGTAVFLDSGVRTGGDNGISTTTANIPQRSVLVNSATIWGVPAEASHNAQRGGRECIFLESGCGSDAPLTPFLSLPTSCKAPGEFTAEVLGTWQDPSAMAGPAKAFVHDNDGKPIGFTGCERLAHFQPNVAIAPDTSYADTPAGLTVDLQMPQGLNPEELNTAGLMNTTVTLPEGVVINPGQATGLQACQPSQEGRGPEGLGSETDEGPPSCPAASKVGTDEIESPLLKETMKGNLYVLQSNPPHLQLLLAASAEGVNLKLIGNVELNPLTGRITTTFKETPDLPFTRFQLAFSGGAQAALATPTHCGVYETTSDFTPWSTPYVSDVLDTGHFGIDAGPGGSQCQWPMPFNPVMSAGATTDQAGGYTDFTMLLARGDEQQRIEKLQFKTPEGLLGMISQVPLCEEPQAARGECPASSQIGHTVVTAGPGPYPFEVPQAGGPPAPIYLTGAYEGAPYGLAIVVPVAAGPFNLGTVVVRARIDVDPHTSQLTITTGALPLILDGIPTDLRAIDAVIDRPNFMFNPTDCTPMSFSGTATSDEGATAPLASHFQVGSCQALKFQPNLKVSTTAKTSRLNGASLDAKIVYPVGNLGFNQASSQSNIQLVKVELPKRLPSRLTTLQKACTAQAFEANPASCPAASVVGHATAITPVLNVPLTGPAYFVSHGGEQFPSLVVVLQGGGVTIDLVGSTFISKAGITSSTFKQVPDVPIGSFELVLPEGPFSALTAVGNLCKGGSLLMPTEFVGHNNALVKQNTKLTVSGCPKAKKASRKKKQTKHKAKKQGGAKRAKGKKKG
jgi:uncharacterized repeat protein (TIGR01451 family)